MRQQRPGSGCVGVLPKITTVAPRSMGPYARKEWPVIQPQSAVHLGGGLREQGWGGGRCVSGAHLGGEGGSRWEEMWPAIQPRSAVRLRGSVAHCQGRAAPLLPVQGPGGGSTQQRGSPEDIPWLHVQDVPARGSTARWEESKEEA